MLPLKIKSRQTSENYGQNLFKNVNFFSKTRTFASTTVKFSQKCPTFSSNAILRPPETAPPAVRGQQGLSLYATELPHQFTHAFYHDLANRDR